MERRWGKFSAMWPWFVPSLVPCDAGGTKTKKFHNEVRCRVFCLYRIMAIEPRKDARIMAVEPRKGVRVSGKTQTGANEVVEKTFFFLKLFLCAM